ncbi:uncharacterized protein METZ01_LOCUS256332, partial [marine metagenome]
DYLLNNPSKEVFNVGTGKGLSVIQAVKAFEEATNNKIRHSIGPRRDGDIEEIFSDNTKIRKALNWKAEKSIDQAMKDAWNWIKDD